MLSNILNLFPQTEGKSVSKKEIVELKNYGILVKNIFFNIFFKTVSIGWWLVFGTCANALNHQEAIAYALFKSYTFNYLQCVHSLLKFNF